MKDKRVKRFLAALIDLSIVILLIYIISIFQNNFSVLYNIPIDSFTLFGVFYSYYIFSEFFFQTTIGKKVFGIRLDLMNKSFQNLFKIVLRNLFNPLELLIPFLYIVPVLVWNKKLGDLISKTELIYE